MLYANYGHQQPGELCSLRAPRVCKANPSRSLSTRALGKPQRKREKGEKKEKRGKACKTIQEGGLAGWNQVNCPKKVFFFLMQVVKDKRFFLAMGEKCLGWAKKGKHRSGALSCLLDLECTEVWDRIIELLRLEGISRITQCHPSCVLVATHQIMLPRIPPNLALCMSRYGASTAQLGLWVLKFSEIFSSRVVWKEGCFLRKLFKNKP